MRTSAPCGQLYTQFGALYPRQISHLLATRLGLAAFLSPTMTIEMLPNSQASLSLNVSLYKNGLYTVKAITQKGEIIRKINIVK